MSLAANRTLQILSKAEREGYGVLAHACYDTQMAMGLVRAAERARSPAILQMFPVALVYGKGPFLRLCLDIAHNATVPIAVHLDHATDAEHVELALGLAEKGIRFDSIMIDASHAKTDEENIAIAKPYVERAHKLGIAVEVELGRLEGGEVGLRTISDAKLTDPKKAKMFMSGTGANIIAPSIGNLHGTYINPPSFRQNILKDLHTEFAGRVPICLHGTHELPDSLLVECIKNGVSKVNFNSRVRYAKAYAEALGTKTLAEAVEIATETFAQISERYIGVFGSTGKA